MTRLNTGNQAAKEFDSQILNLAHAGSEADFLRQVTKLATALGWSHFHQHYSLGADSGWPDLVLCREKRDGTASLLFIELKREKGVLTEAQKDWLSLLGKVPGVAARCVRPSQLGELIRLLGVERMANERKGIRCGNGL